MSDQERILVEDLIRSGPDLSSGTVADIRENYEHLGEITPPCGGVSFTAGTVGGVPGEFIKPDHATSDALIVYFHGGGYMIGSLNSHRGLVSLLAAAAGITAFSVDYRLAPEHPCPAAADDALAVYRALLDGGLAPDRIVFAGDSAGGGLALTTLMQARNGGVPLPAAAFLMSPFVDLAGTGESVSIKQDVDVVVRPGMIEGMGGTYLAGRSTQDPIGSPLYGDVTGLPPLMIHVGTYEAILDDSLRLARKAALADVHVELKIWPKMPHVFQLFAGMLGEGRQSLAEAGQFLRSRLDERAATTIDQ